MSSRGEAFEEKVVVRDNLRGRQNWGIAREMRVGYQRHIIAKRNGTAASGVDTVLGHGAGNDELPNSIVLKSFCESRLEERI